MSRFETYRLRLVYVTTKQRPDQAKFVEEKKLEKTTIEIFRGGHNVVRVWKCHVADPLFLAGSATPRVRPA